MEPPSPIAGSSPSPAARAAARAAALVAAALGALALLGWALGLPALAGFGSSFIPMAPSTAACFLLVAGAVVVRTTAAPPALAWLPALPAMALAAAALDGHAHAFDSLFAAARGTFHGVPLGVMSPMTAVGLLPLPLVGLLPGSRRGRQALAAAGLWGGSVGLLVVLGYGFGTPLLEGGAVIPSALTTGLALVAAGVADMAVAGSDRWPLRDFAGPTVRARLMRATVPLGLGALLLHGFLTHLPFSRLGNPAVVEAVVGFATFVALTLVATRISQVVSASIASAEAARRESDQRFRTLIEQLPDFVCVHRAGGDVLFTNPALQKALGQPEQDLLGRTFESLVHGDDRRVAAAAQGGAPREQRWLRTDGGTVTVEATSRPIAFAGGPAVLVVARDVAERRKLEEQLRQAQKMEAVGQLAGGVAHDFNNLLTVILSFGSFLKQSLEPDHPGRADVEEILAAGDRAAALTRRLLAFSRRQPFDPAILDLNEVLAGMEKMLRRLIGEDVDLALVPGPSLGRVRADRSHVEQVVMNLVVNARDAMPRGGKLTLETTNVVLDPIQIGDRPGLSPGPHVLLAVTDTGTGMDLATLARIFEPFFTTKGLGKGTGLGLSTVYGIVKQSGGDVQVYSAVGRGTTFKIYLPCHVAGDEPRPEKRAATRAATRHETVLLVEDDPAVRAAARRVLADGGYEVIAEGCPSDAVARARAHSGPIHVLVTDVVMPEMNGRELVDEVRRIRPDVRVLFTSGYTGGALLHQGIVDSGAAYLQKPFTPDALLEKVRGTLEA